MAKSLTRSLQLRGYRTFDRYEINDLARVNLFVGKNGCGKTSVLEAIRILATHGSISVLTDIAFKRGEVRVLEDPARGREEFLPLVNHFFHGRKLLTRASFTIVGDESVDLVHAEIGDAPENEGQQNLFAEYEDVVPFYTISIAENVFPVSYEGALYAGRAYRSPRLKNADRWSTPVQFIRAESLRIDLMSKMWNQVILDSQDSDVIDALRILDPSIEGVFFLGEFPARGSQGSVLLSFDDERGRIPLGSTGEGMRRLLALALSLAQVKGGVLLIDEIDTGLHYSVLGRMWHLIVEAARKSNIQVFATTHSLDCVKGLAWLCENHPELISEVAMHKIDPTLEHAVTLDAEQIMIADQQGIEIR